VATAAVIGRSAAVPDRALAWSLLGHGVLALLVLLGGFVIHRTPPHTQLAIKATVVDPRQLRQPRAAPDPVPKPEPAPVPDADRQLKEQQAEKKRRAEQQKRELAAQREKELLAKQRAEKAKADLAEKQRQEKAAAERARQAKAEADRAKAEAEAERLKAAREKEEAARRTAAEAASKRDMARQLEEEERLLAAADSGALAAYLALIRQKVERNWVRPPSAKPGLECEVLVTQIPGGQVTAVRMGNCNADDAVRRSIEAAVLRASPLPLPDEAALFERNLRFTFKPEQ
jgi:colicin import membrane protein